MSMTHGFDCVDEALLKLYALFERLGLAVPGTDQGKNIEHENDLQ